MCKYCLSTIHSEITILQHLPIQHAQDLSIPHLMQEYVPPERLYDVLAPWWA